MNPCHKCGGELYVMDNFVNGGLISINVDGHARPAHRFCPGDETLEIWKAYEFDALARGYAHGLARANRRGTPSKRDWATARGWAAERMIPPQPSADAAQVKA